MCLTRSWRSEFASGIICLQSDELPFDCSCGASLLMTKPSFSLVWENHFQSTFSVDIDFWLDRFVLFLFLCLSPLSRCCLLVLLAPQFPMKTGVISNIIPLYGMCHFPLFSRIFSFLIVPFVYFSFMSFEFWEENRRNSCTLAFELEQGDLKFLHLNLWPRM